VTDVSIVQRPRTVFGRDLQHGAQIVQRLEAHVRLRFEPHAGAPGAVEHPDRDVEAVAALVARHMAAQHMRARAALLAFDQNVLAEEGMPGVLHTPQLRALSVVCGDSNITSTRTRASRG
jgi:hypothetical protein